MRNSILVMFGALSFPTLAVANEAALRACTEVYKNATNNLSQGQQTSVELARSFSSFCKKDGSVNTSASGIGLDAVVNSIPFNFSANSSSSSQRLSEFCRIGQTQFDSWNSGSFATSTVANEALSNFNSCVQLANSGLQLSVAINQPDSLTVSGFANAGYSGFINSVAYDNQFMNCTSANFDPQQQSQILHGAVSLRISQPFAITCVKKSQPSSDGRALHYPRTTLTISASALSPLAIVFPSDTLNGFELASQANLAVSNSMNEVNLANESAAAQRRLAESLQSRLSRVTANVTTHEFGSGAPWGCGPYGSDWGRGLREEAQRVCGGNNFVLGSNNVRGGGQCGYGSNGFACIVVPPN